MILFGQLGVKPASPVALGALMARPPRQTALAGEDSTDPMPMQSEGDHIGTRKFGEEQAASAKSGKVADKAAEAEAALDGPRGDVLEAARAAAVEGKSVKKPG